VEEGGFVATTNSDKLPNGKVKGTIVVRVAPDRLDALVAKLRALGDLKSQNLAAQDITKQYTDLESQFRAAKAMEDRLLDMIKNGNGAIKELLAAEKELGVWREKIEKVQGEINYYNNLVSLSTLSVTMFEKDISTSASLCETEMVDMGVESDDVEKARAEAIKAIDEAKGRIIESTLKQFDAGQLAARIVAEVPPQQAGSVSDRLKQLGKIARLDIQRATSTPNNTTLAPGSRIERKDTRIIVSLYNLANVAPRETTNLNIACDDVETTYRAILSRVVKAGGRVVSSNLSTQKSDQANAAIVFEVRLSDASSLLGDVKALGQVVRLTVTENPDTANVTTAKQGFSVQLLSVSQVPPREITSLTVESNDVDAAARSVASICQSVSGKLVDSSLSKEAGGRSTARFVIEVPMSQSDKTLDQIKSTGKVRAVQTTGNAQVPDGPLARQRVELTIVSPESIVSADSGLWASLRQALATSFAGLMWSLQLIVIGLCLVAPWALVIWGGWKVVRRRRTAVT
ncbi:MAG: DUF4349 domain-containing protein, partial [Tepidisphaeraceae bacterium]